METIGDAYVAVANLVKQQPDDHAKRIASFAVEAIVAANKTLVDVDDETKGFVNIRVGFNSGPSMSFDWSESQLLSCGTNALLSLHSAVVADVVGTTNPRFCLFGDSMNTGRLFFLQ